MASPIAFRQTATGSATGITSIDAMMFEDEVAGDLNVVVVTWSVGAVTAPVTDPEGHLYRPIANPTTQTTVGTAQLFYAADVAGTTQPPKLTATVSGATTGVIRALEYAGIGASPLGTDAEVSGTGASIASGGITVSADNSLIFATVVMTGSGSAEGTFFQSRGTVDGIFVEDALGVPMGPDPADASMINGGTGALPWVELVATFDGR